MAIIVVTDRCRSGGGDHGDRIGGGNHSDRTDHGGDRGHS